MRISARTAAVVGGAVLFIATSASTASADPISLPPNSGCPAAAQVFSADYLAGLGYVAGPAADVNGDGVVCGIRFEDRAALQIFGPDTCLQLIGCFLWGDDNLTPLH
jgi:hypothetical protein